MNGKFEYIKKISFFNGPFRQLEWISITAELAERGFSGQDIQKFWAGISCGCWPRPGENKITP
jgi:hypothetical protein